MYFAYFDESGDAGVINSPTKFFVLSCVLVPDSAWMPSLNTLVGLRKLLRQHYAIPTRPELKATDIRRGRGPLLDLNWSPAQRMTFYKWLMVFQATKLPEISCFSIAIDKAKAFAKNREPRETAWEFAMQRVNRFCIGKNSYACIFPDEGHGAFIKRMMRKMRRFHHIPRHWGSGALSFPTDRILEDPNDRQSHDSYFIQLADWNAFACHRSQYIDPRPGVDPDLWDSLGERRLKVVNAVRGGPPAIVLYPK